MKILVLTNLYPPFHLGDYEFRCRAVVTALRAHGHEVYVLTSDHGLTGGATVPEETQVERMLQIHGCYGHPKLPLPKLKGLEIHNNNTLREAINIFQPEVTLVWNLDGLSKSLALTLQALNLPTVFDVANPWIARSLAEDVWLHWWNSQEGPLPDRLLKLWWQWLGVRDQVQPLAPTNPVAHLRFSRLYFCSAALRAMTEQAGYEVAHGAVIPCPVNTHRYQGTPRAVHLPTRDWLYAGPLTEEKGVITLLKALALVKKKFQGRLYLYGKGDPAYEKSLREMIAEENLPVFFESAKHEQMPEVYPRHEVLIYPSTGEETFPLTPLEAMACGLAVIGTSTGGGAELLRHGENALTFKPGDDAALAGHLMELQRNQALRLRLATAGQAEARAHYSEPQIVKQIEAYLAETISHWSPVELPDYRG